MMESRFLLIFAHTFIGVGLAYIHIFHVSNVFEIQNNFRHLSKIEREIVFNQDQAIYYHYFKTIVEEESFNVAYNKLLNDNLTEYPLVINAVNKYHIFPEIIIGYLYRQFISITKYFDIPTVVCWSINRGKMDDVVSCEGIGEAIYFYLSIVWGLSGVTVFLLYTYGTFISRNIVGGLSAVLYYFIIHNNATSVHVTPFSRENLAFPFILSQIFYLTLLIQRYKNIDFMQLHRVNIALVWNLSVVTTFSLLCWHFSSIIFITQIFSLFLLLEFNAVSKNLVLDYTISQFLSVIIANVLMYRTLFSSLHLTLIMALFVIVSSKIDPQTRLEQMIHGPQMSKFKKFLCNLLFMFIIAYSLTDIQETFVNLKNFLIPSLKTTSTTTAADFNNNKVPVNQTTDDDISRYYMSLILTKLGLLTPTFNSILYFANPLHDFISLETLKLFNYVFVIKNISIVIIIFLGRFLQRRRDKYNNLIKNELIERAKNYVIEDYLEENRINMQNLTDPKTEKEIKSCVDLLATFNYDYDRYKKEKRKNIPNVIDEKKSFLSDIKKLKSQINEKEKKERGIDVDDIDDKKDTNQNKDKEVTDANDTDKKSKDEQNDTAEKDEKTNTTDAEESKAEESTTKPPTTDEPNASQSQKDKSDFNFIQATYLYSIIQTLFLFVMTVLVCKIKFIFAPFLCVIASSLPCRTWFSHNSNVYWILYTFLLLCNIVNPGLKNLYKQYEQPPSTLESAEVEELLEWIDTNTEPNAIFGGTSDITATILLATRRPIVNHPLNEYSKARHRTKKIYSVYSKKSHSVIHNELVKIVVQYVVIPYDSCFMPLSNGLKISDIWDMVEVENHNNTQYCVTVYENSKVINFLKVFNNYKYLVIKLFSRSVQLDVKKIKKYLKYDM